MAGDLTTLDPLAWLARAMATDLADHGASAEYHYTSPERGSLTVNRHGKAIQSSYFAAFELQALRAGGVKALEMQKLAMMEQVQRVITPPTPVAINLAGLYAARRGRGASVKKGAQPAPDSEDNAEVEGASE